MKSDQKKSRAPRGGPAVAATPHSDARAWAKSGIVIAIAILIFMLAYELATIWSEVSTGELPEELGWAGTIFMLVVSAIVLFCAQRVWSKQGFWAAHVLAGISVVDAGGNLWMVMEGESPNKILGLSALQLAGCYMILKGIWALKELPPEKLHEAGEGLPSSASSAAPSPLRPVTRSDEVPVEHTGSLSKDDIGRLEQLVSLHGRGVLSDAEFARQKDMILSGR
jgi:hypothetical protein